MLCLPSVLSFLKLVLQLKTVCTGYNCSGMSPISLLTAHNCIAHYFIMLRLYDGNNGFAISNHFNVIMPLTCAVLNIFFLWHFYSDHHHRDQELRVTQNIKKKP